MTGSRVPSRRSLPCCPVASHKVYCTFIACVFALLVMCGAPSFAQSAISLPAAINFGSVATGVSSSVQTVTFTFTGSATLGSTPYGVFTQGTTVLDFRAAASQGGAACMASRTYSIGNTCTVQIMFAPARPGLSLGAVQLLDSNLAAVATATFSGTGTGPLLTFPNATPTTLYSGSPLHVAVDRSGDVFIGESTSTSGNGVVKVFIATQGVIPSVGTPVTIAANFGIITGLAVDGTGNIFVADNGTGSVKEIVAVDGSYITNPAIETVYIGTPRSVAFDAAGNLLVADAGSVKRLAPVNGVISTASPVTTIASNFNNPSGLAVSPAGDVYVSDTGNNAVKQIVAANGTVSPASTVTNIYVASGSSPQDLSVDAAGDLYIAFHGINRILEDVAVNGALPASPNFVLVGGTGIIYPTSVAVNSRGDIYFADDTANTVSMLDQGDPPTFTFASTQPPNTSSDSPQRFTLANGGNVSLVFPVPTSGTNPSEPVDFTVAGSTACPVLTTASTTATTLAPGAQCAQSVSFKPTVAGPIAETSTYTDNSLNVVGATQSVSLNGFGYGNLAITAITVSMFGNSTTYVGSTYAQEAIAFLYNLSGTAIQLPTPTLTDTTNFSATDDCNGMIAANSLCRVSFTFHPTAVGTFTATYSVADAANPTAPASLTFSAVAVAAPVDSTGNYTVQTFPISGTLTGITVDPSNNVYLPVVVSGTGRLLEALPAVNGVETLNQPTQQIATGTVGTQGVTTDDQGNIYLIDNTSTGYEVKELLAVNGTVPANPVALILFSTTSSGNYSPSLNPYIAVDHNGDVFFEDFVDGYPSAYEYLYELVAVAGAVPPVNPTIRTLGQTYTQTGGPGSQSSQNFIQTLATDSANNVFYVYEADGLFELPAVNGTLPANVTAQKLPGAPDEGGGDRYAGPFAVDSKGDVIYAYTASVPGGGLLGQILELTAVNGVLPMYPQVQILYSQPVSAFRAAGIALDHAGNILVANSAGSNIIRLTPGGTPTGNVSIAPTTQTFPDTVVGQVSSTQTSTFSNTTSNAINLNAGALSDAADFTQSDNCNGQVAAGASCTVTFAFTPQSVGPLSSTYSISTGSQGWTVGLSGNGTPASVPQAMLSPTSLTFTTVVNTAAYNQTVMLTNAGTTTLNIASLAISGTNASSFTIVTNGCGATLAGGASCNVTIGFPIIVAGTYSAILTATDNASPSTQTLSLSGTVTGTAQAVLMPATPNLGTITLGSNASQTLTLTNAGTASLSITAVSSPNSVFALTGNTCGNTLAAGAACTYTVVFTPTGTGVQSETFSVTDSVGTQTATLSGTGAAAPAPIAGLSPNPLAFGNVVVNTSTGTMSVTVSNTGTAQLNLGGLTLGGANPTAFKQGAGTCDAVVAAGSSCTYGFTFTPPSAGNFSATVTVTDNATPTTQVVMLTGSGIIAATDYTVAATNPAQSVQPGGVAQFALNIAPVGGSYSQPVVLTVTGLPAGATASFNPASVRPGSSGAPSMLSVQTAPLTGMLQRPDGGSTVPLFAALLLFPLLGIRRLRRKLRMLPLSARVLFLAILALGGTAAIAGCGGGYYGPQPQTVTLTVTGTSGPITHSTTVTLTIQ